MVAETSPVPAKPKAKFRPTFPLPLKLKIRSLYVIQQESPAAIGEKVGLTRQQVQNLITRERWVVTKRRAKESFQAKQDARTKAEVDEVIEAVAVQTEDLSLRVLDKASRAMDREDKEACRDLQALSQTAKNFVGMARQARGLDAEIKAERDGRGNVILFAASFERIEAAPMKRAEKTADAQPALEASVKAIPDSAQSQ